MPKKLPVFEKAQTKVTKTVGAVAVTKMFLSQMSVPLMMTS